jgi:hypothetical protein
MVCDFSANALALVRFEENDATTPFLGIEHEFVVTSGSEPPASPDPKRKQNQNVLLKE